MLFVEALEDEARRFRTGGSDVWEDLSDIAALAESLPISEDDRAAEPECEAEPEPEAQPDLSQFAILQSSAGRESFVLDPDAEPECDPSVADTAEVVGRALDGDLIASSDVRFVICDVCELHVIQSRLEAHLREEHGQSGPPSDIPHNQTWSAPGVQLGCSRDCTGDLEQSLDVVSIEEPLAATLVAHLRGHASAGRDQLSASAVFGHDPSHSPALETARPQARERADSSPVQLDAPSTAAVQDRYCQLSPRASGEPLPCGSCSSGQGGPGPPGDLPLVEQRGPATLGDMHRSPEVTGVGPVSSTEVSQWLSADAPDGLAPGVATSRTTEDSSAPPGWQPYSNATSGSAFSSRGSFVALVELEENPVATQDWGSPSSAATVAESRPAVSLLELAARVEGGPALRRSTANVLQGNGSVDSSDQRQGESPPTTARPRWDPRRTPQHDQSADTPRRPTQPPEVGRPAPAPAHRDLQSRPHRGQVAAMSRTQPLLRRVEPVPSAEVSGLLGLAGFFEVDGARPDLCFDQDLALFLPEPEASASVADEERPAIGFTDMIFRGVEFPRGNAPSWVPQSQAQGAQPTRLPPLADRRRRPGRTRSVAEAYADDLAFPGAPQVSGSAYQVDRYEGLHPGLLARIPTVKFHPERWIHVSLDHKQCMVCLGEFKKGENLRRLPCMHSYHAACIDEWFDRSTLCPVCKCDVRHVLA
eukprot:CAMPEP_0204338290 /NCGR_PEP_ID=MMETSP0469-20131031/20954_1 /ASSEMBLY_ACC=CAM_ASM_000384 /TAXON_ID=2969 /ORGANISM="Oxyrrhis marina" /LENGTH=703 /DNA_ID=CAMNT_0051322441 /DNA_START=41 /DNA_END=2149 /DNA_ORIENTATION=-